MWSQSRSLVCKGQSVAESHSRGSESYCSLHLGLQFRDYLFVFVINLDILDILCYKLRIVAARWRSSYHSAAPQKDLNPLHLWGTLCGCPWTSSGYPSFVPQSEDMLVR